MATVEVSRTLIKSPAELWADLEGGRLAEAIGDGADVRPTEPERALAWEAEGAFGTALLEPSGFGTKVTLVARVPEAARAPEPEPPPPTPLQEEIATVEPEVAKRGLWSRLRWWRSEPTPESEPEAAEPQPSPEPEPEPDPLPELDPADSAHDIERRLTALLESLGTAHRKPFTRNG